MKILILKPSSLGDVVQAMPVLRLLKLAYPDSEIFWWIDSRLAPLLEGDRDLAGVILFERRGWGKLARWKNLVREIFALRKHNFDLVIDLQGLARSGIFAWLANGKLLVGLDERREGANGFYDLIVRRATFHTHAVDWYLSVLSPLGVAVHKNFEWLPERLVATASVREKFSPQGKRWLAVQPGARWMNKRWPVENYAALVTQLAAQFPDLHFAILGGAEERALGEVIAVAAPSRALNLCGQLTLPEMIEWLRLCAVMVTNDTGPMHVAAALGKPVVGIFGPTEPGRTGPYGQLDKILRVPLPCAPCFKATCANPLPLECLRLVTPAAVAARVSAIL